ncbi:MAG: hypothetical protein KF832_32000 [Caldilineaceae bacterium]|nr:hypothetical protein [Caldilineaceae bacterium]
MSWSQWALCGCLFHKAAVYKAGVLARLLRVGPQGLRQITGLRRAWERLGTNSTTAWGARGLSGFFLLLVTLFVLAFQATKPQPLYAAVEFSAFDVLVLPTGVVLEWQTVSEYDLLGFEVWYKPERASQSAYRLLGKRVAQGAPQRGVTYRMDVTAALQAEEAYCFQLRELPINGERGEILNRCGYGLGISAQPTPTPTLLFTPTPTVTLTLTGTNPLTDTLIITDATTPLAPILLPSPPMDAGALNIPPTPTPAQLSDSVLPTPLDNSALPAETPVIPQPVSPLTMPSPMTMPLDNEIAAASVPTDSLTQPETLTANTLYTDPTTFNSSLSTPPVAAVVDPPYIVLTATATPETLASIPTFTPYPTTLAQPAASLAGVPIPDTQNLMIMLLCGIFSGASGLGILGLVSTLLYMRSRAEARQNRPSQR